MIDNRSQLFLIEESSVLFCFVLFVAVKVVGFFFFLNLIQQLMNKLIQLDI